MSDLETLLALQDHDTEIDRIRHRRSTLPSRLELEAVRARIAALDELLTVQRVVRDEVIARQRQLEHDVVSVEARIAEVDKRLYSGAVSASRELQAMSAEVDSLKTRLAALEDGILAAMEECEPLAAAVDALEAETTTLAAEADRLTAVLTVDEGALAATEATESAARSGLADQIPDALLADYERLRTRLGGVGAARIVGHSCSGCHLTLPAMEMEQIKNAGADDVVHCDQCGRIVVFAG